MHNKNTQKKTLHRVKLTCNMLRSNMLWSFFWCNLGKNNCLLSNEYLWWPPIHPSHLPVIPIVRIGPLVLKEPLQPFNSGDGFGGAHGELTYIPYQGTFEDDCPFRQVKYVRSLGSLECIYGCLGWLGWCSFHFLSMMNLLQGIFHCLQHGSIQLCSTKIQLCHGGVRRSDSGTVLNFWISPLETRI